MHDQQIIGPLSFPSIKRVVVFLVSLAVGHIAFALATFPGLPETIPLHFDASGSPDAFGTTSLSSWLVLWLVGAVLGAIAMVGGLWIFRAPLRYLSIPSKRAFASLPAASRSRALAVLAFHVLVLGGLAMGIMLVIHIALALAAHGVVERFPTPAIWIAIVAVILEVIVATVRFSQAVTREVNAQVRGDGS